jgi:hypothetical protein
MLPGHIQVAATPEKGRQECLPALNLLRNRSSRPVAFQSELSGGGPLRDAKE